MSGLWCFERFCTHLACIVAFAEIHVLFAVGLSRIYAETMLGLLLGVWLFNIWMLDVNFFVLGRNWLIFLLKV